MRLVLTITIEWCWKPIDQSVEVWNEETKSLHIVGDVNSRRLRYGRVLLLLIDEE